MHFSLSLFLSLFLTVSYYSECNSNRDSVLSYTSVRSNSSYLGSDEMGSGKRLSTTKTLRLVIKKLFKALVNHLPKKVAEMDVSN